MNITVDSFPSVFGSKRILWQNLSGSYIIGLDRLSPISAVACLDDGLEFDLVTERSGVRFCSRERTTRRREPIPDPTINTIIPSLRQEIEEALSTAPAESWIWLCPRPCSSLEVYAREHGLRAGCPPAELCHWLNHKANFFQGLDAAGLPRLRGEWMPLSATNHAELCSRFGGSFAMQAPRGVRGSGTALVKTEDDYRAAAGRLPDGDVWVAPYAGDLSLNINAFVMESRTAVSYPSVQLVGLSMLNTRPGGYCGNDFTSTAALPPEMILDAFEQAERVGAWLATLGYRGIFGLDLVVCSDTGRLYAVDLNPRWQGSTSLEIQATLRKGRIPLAAAEMAYQSGVLGESEIAPMLDGFRQPIEGSQLLLYAAGPEAVEIREPLRPGVYSLGEGLEFVRPALELGEGVEADQLLLTNSLPRAGTAIEPQSRPVRIFSVRPVLDMDSLQPRQWAGQAAGQVYRALGLKTPG